MNIMITHDVPNDIALRWLRFTLHAKRVAWSNPGLFEEVMEMRKWCGDELTAMPKATGTSDAPVISFASLADATAFKMRWM